MPPESLPSTAASPATISAAVAAQAAGRLRARDLVEAARAAADRCADLNPIAWTDWPAALAQADACDAQVRAGRPLAPLHGVPVTVKDLFKVRGRTMQAGTRAALPAFEPDEAAAVARLRAAGAIVVAVTNMHEIAMGASGENAWTGDVLNPFDPARQAGGSSSGAGVCVARGVGYVGLGSDTGGSIRIPANFCGVVGFKPSFGAVPLAGALHLSWTCDHGGPLTRSVADARVAFEALSGRSTSHGGVPRRPRLALPARWLAGRVGGPAAERFAAMLAALRAAGADIVEVDAPTLPQAGACYLPIVRAEAAWVHRAAMAAGGEGFSAPIRQGLTDGAAFTAAQWFDAMQVRDRLAAELRALTADADAIVLPSSAVLPPLRGQLEVQGPAGPMTVREAVLGQTLPFNLSGQPAITLPAGLMDGLPTGLQLVGAVDRDASLLALAEWTEGVIAGAVSSS